MKLADKAAPDFANKMFLCLTMLRSTASGLSKRGLTVMVSVCLWLGLTLGVSPEVSGLPIGSRVSNKCCPGASGPYFVQNVGQLRYSDTTAASDVIAYAVLGDVSVYVRQTGISYVMRKSWLNPDAWSQNPNGGAFVSVSDTTLSDLELYEMKPRGKHQLDRVDMRLDSANTPSSIQFKDTLTSTSSFTYDTSSWSGALHFRRIRINGVYDDIDWEIYISADGKLKYDYIVHPGGDPDDIVEHYPSCLSMCMGGGMMGGCLLVEFNLGQLVQEKPFVYQADPDLDQRAFAAAYNIDTTTRRVRIDIAPGWNSSLDLIIDPYLTWATYGGNGNGANSDENRFTSVATDASDNSVWVLGNALKGTTIPDEVNEPISTYDFDCYVLKFNDDGALLNSHVFGGDHFDFGHEIVIDNENTAWIVGVTMSKSFPDLNNQPQNHRHIDPENRSGWPSESRTLDLALGKERPAGFVVQLNTASNAVEYATHFLTNRGTVCTTIAVNRLDNSIWVGGSSNVWGWSNSFMNDPDMYDDIMRPCSCSTCCGYPPLVDPADRSSVIATSFNYLTPRMADGDGYVAFVIRLKNDLNTLYDENNPGDYYPYDLASVDPPTKIQEHGRITYFAQVGGNGAFNEVQDIEVDNAGNVWLLGTTNSDACLVAYAPDPATECCGDHGVISNERDGIDPYCNRTILDVSSTEDPFKNARSLECKHHYCFNDCAPCSTSMVGCRHCLCDLYLMKFTPTDSVVQYFTYIGGEYEEGLRLEFGWGSEHHSFYQRPRLSVSPNGEHVWVGGFTRSPDLFEEADGPEITTTPLQAAMSEGDRSDGFLLYFDGAGEYQYGTYLGGAGEQRVTGLKANNDGTAWVGGYTFTGDMASHLDVQSAGQVDAGDAYVQARYADPNRDDYTQPRKRGGEIFLSKIDPTETEPVFFTYYGGINNEALTDMTLNSAGELLLVGFTNSLCLGNEFQGLPLYRPDAQDVHYLRYPIGAPSPFPDQPPKYEGLIVRFSPAPVAGDGSCGCMGKPGCVIIRDLDCLVGCE